MKRKRHTAEEIIRKLREVEQMEAAGQPVAHVPEGSPTRPPVGRVSAVPRVHHRL
jgi:hypothetical protein